MSVRSESLFICGPIPEFPKIALPVLDTVELLDAIPDDNWRIPARSPESLPSWKRNASFAKESRAIVERWTDALELAIASVSNAHLTDDKGHYTYDVLAADTAEFLSDRIYFYGVDRIKYYGAALKALNALVTPPTQEKDKPSAKEIKTARDLVSQIYAHPEPLLESQLLRGLWA